MPRHTPIQQVQVAAKMRNEQKERLDAASRHLAKRIETARERKSGEDVAKAAGMSRQRLYTFLATYGSGAEASPEPAPEPPSPER